MKHPLTSKERRGLVAVAAAALLCIAAGPLVRFCNPSSGIRNARDVVSAPDLSGSSDTTVSNDTISHHKTVTERKRKTKNKSGGKSKKSKTYPTRQPLDEEIWPEN